MRFVSFQTTSDAAATTSPSHSPGGDCPSTSVRFRSSARIQISDSGDAETPLHHSDATPTTETRSNGLRIESATDFDANQSESRLNFKPSTSNDRL